MAAANNDSRQNCHASNAENGAESPIHQAEIVDSAAMTTAPGRLTRGQVARRLGLSTSTVRRMEGAELKPILGERGVHYFEETEIQAVFVRIRRTRVPNDECAEGELAAAAFSLFRSGADVVAAVKELREPPEKLETLHTQWKRLRGIALLDAKSVATLAGDLGLDELADETPLIAALVAYKKEVDQSCVLCQQAPAHLCRECARDLGRAHAQEAHARKLF